MSNVETITKPKPPKAAPDSAPHVIRAMNLVSARLAEEGISKSRSNSQQGYKFRGIDEVLNALSAIISSEKLVIIPHVQSRDVTERQTKSGGALFSVVVRVDYTFISAEDGSREVVGPFDGEAMDSADKATNKAMSAAYKYMAIQTFCIPTEGDNDADATTHEVVPAAGGERTPLRDPQTRQQQATPQVRPQARKFVDKACADIEAAGGDVDAVWATFDEIKARPGWEQLSASEKQVVILAKGKALPNDAG
jgi:hypothetical protein